MSVAAELLCSSDELAPLHVRDDGCEEEEDHEERDAVERPEALCGGREGVGW